MKGKKRRKKIGNRSLSKFSNPGVNCKHCSEDELFAFDMGEYLSSIIARVRAVKCRAEQEDSSMH